MGLEPTTFCMAIVCDFRMDWSQASQAWSASERERR
jgi:hypothetical protein